MAWEFLAAILGGSFGAATYYIFNYIKKRAEALNAHTEGYTQEALEAISNAELERILYSMGISSNMTKANMVTLILAMQEESEI